MEETRSDAGLSDALELIHRVNAAVASADVATVAAVVHPDAVWEHNLGVGTPEEGVYRGRDSVVRLFERIVEPWEYIRAEPREIDQLSEGRYRVTGELRAKHRTSDAEIVAPYEQLLEIREGALVKGQMKTGEIPFP